MRIAIASDHGGYRLKEEIKTWLAGQGHEIQDFGTAEDVSCDYPDYAVEAARAVAGGHCDRGILVCGTGIGMSIAANKIKGIRAALCHDTFSARMSREHNDANILALGERVIGRGLAQDIVEIWLQTGFAGGRHQRRIEKISMLDNKI